MILKSDKRSPKPQVRLSNAGTTEEARDSFQRQLNPKIAFLSPLPSDSIVIDEMRRPVLLVNACHGAVRKRDEAVDDIGVVVPEPFGVAFIDSVWLCRNDECSSTSPSPVSLGENAVKQLIRAIIRVNQVCDTQGSCGSRCRELIRPDPHGPKMTPYLAPIIRESRRLAM